MNLPFFIVVFLVGFLGLSPLWQPASGAAISISAMITAMLGLAFAQFFGLLAPDQLYAMPTMYGAQIGGGLIFGIGFVIGGWCPGTAAVGAASGKLDGMVFLGGAVIGSIIFNEVFLLIQPLYTWGQEGVVFIYQTLNLGRPGVALLLTLVAVASFWGAEFLEPSGGNEQHQFLTCFSLALVGLAGGLLLFSGFSQPSLTALKQEKVLLDQVEDARDHMEPEELAGHLLRGNPSLLLVDIRPAEEYHGFHLRGALNLPLNQLSEGLIPYRDKDLIVLYSNGMTHPAQARDSLYRQGFRNIYILTDGLQGFLERCLKPVSLRDEPLSPGASTQVRVWREYFGSP